MAIGYRQMAATSLVGPIQVSVQNQEEEEAESCSRLGICPRGRGHFQYGTESGFLYCASWWSPPQCDQRRKLYPSFPPTQSNHLENFYKSPGKGLTEGEGGHRTRKTADPLESLSCSSMSTSMKRNSLSEAGWWRRGVGWGGGASCS